MHVAGHQVVIVDPTGGGSAAANPWGLCRAAGAQLRAGPSSWPLLPFPPAAGASVVLRAACISSASPELLTEPS